MVKIIYAKLIAVRDGEYIQYVFQDLETKRYVMCTKVPNWKVPDIMVGDSGYLEYQQVIAGEEYFNPTTEVTQKYKYSNVYFINFGQKTDIIQNNTIIL